MKTNRTNELSSLEAAHHSPISNRNASERSSRMELGLCLSDSSAILQSGPVG